MNKRALTWITGGDTGVSSETIWAVMMDSVSKSGWYGTPLDGSDFGRCYRLLKAVPEWRSHLCKVADKFPAWRPLVDKWDKLEIAYESDLKDNGRRTYDMINRLMN